MLRESPYTFYPKDQIDEVTRKSWQYTNWVVVESEEDGGIIAEFSNEEDAQLFCLVRRLADSHEDVGLTEALLESLISAAEDLKQYKKWRTERGV